MPEALDAVKARLKSLNADVEVEQEEYDEVVVIKACSSTTIISKTFR